MHASRRQFCFLGLGLAACGGEFEGHDVTGVPWHMWGSVQTLQITSVGPSAPVIPATALQLLQVTYARPESWGFMCSARLVSVTPAAGVGGLIQLDYLVQLGLGRSTIIIPNFVSFQFDPNTDVSQQRWTSVAFPPKRFNSDTVPLPPIDSFTAQNIQAQANCTYVQLPGPFTALIEVAMHVAPRQHIRPEWFTAADPHNVKKFRGSEQGGL